MPRALPALGGELAEMELLDVPTAPAGAVAKMRTLAAKSPDVAATAMSLRNAATRPINEFMGTANLLLRAQRSVG